MAENAVFKDTKRFLFQVAILRHLQVFTIFFKDKISKIMPKNVGEIDHEEVVLYLFLNRQWVMCIEHVFTNKKEKGVEMSDLKLLNSDYNYIAVHL